MDELLSKVQGCLMGVLLGDALGMPWEMYSKDDILAATRGEGIVQFDDSPQRRFRQMRDLKPGDCTDDWQLTRALALSIIDMGEYSRYQSARALVQEYRRTTAGWGKTTKSAAKDLDEFFRTNGGSGRDPLFSLPTPEPGKGCGNGVAMRIAPLSIYTVLRRTPPLHEMTYYLYKIVKAEGAITHPDPRASAAAFAAASIILNTLFETFSPRKNPEGFDNQKIILQELLTTLQKIPGGDYRELIEKLDRIHNHLEILESPEALRAHTGTSCFALESVPFAIGTFLRHPSDFRVGVLEAINAGGDTDTNASMVGAMIGANVGLEGIPEEWIKFRLEYQEALEIGQQLFEVCKNL